MLYIVLLSIHGLIRGRNLELGCDADTGGQVLYVLELAKALAKQPSVAQVDLVTRRIVDPVVDEDYGQPIEKLADKLRIVRINAGPDEYLAKEQLWDHLDSFTDSMIDFFHKNHLTPDIIHSHYADAGYVGASIANQLGVPLIHTGHSLGRVKRDRLLASGLAGEEIESRYNISHRIEAEEITLATADRVITSTLQEIEEQYELYDYYHPEQMRVLPPGTNLQHFMPPSGGERETPFFYEISKHLKEPIKPFILALSRPDQRKNIISLVEAYGNSLPLQELANLIIVAGTRENIDDLDDGTQEVFHELLCAIDHYDIYSKVALPKHHKRENIPLLYRIAAASGGVFVNPALTEPFGLTLIEAAASGLPIIATEDGGPQDIINNCQNGFLINPLEVESISTAILTLLQNKKRWLQFAENGQQGVKQHYSWNSHAKRYLQLIQPIIDRSEVLVRKKVQQRRKLDRDRALISDLDQNLISDQTSLAKLIKILRSHRKSTKFVIATGRRFDSALRVMRKYKIPDPDILITSSGTGIYYAPEFSVDKAWKKHIDYHWSPNQTKAVLAEIPGLKIQPKSEQSRFKISYYIDRESAPDFEEISSLLHKNELSVNLNIAFGQFLDVLPIRASKGLALRYVADRWRIPLERILVAGGSGADEDMMRGNTLALVVANRHHEELSMLTDIDRIYFATKPFAEGILEAAEYYDFFGSCQVPSPKICR